MEHIRGFHPVDPRQLGIDDPHMEIDPTVASPARMYDYYLGGKDNFTADREAADAVIAAHPEQRQLARANRGFLHRAVRYLAEQDIEQFLDLGTGIPTSPNVHEVAREIQPDARVVYVDNDPVVNAHSRALGARHDGIVSVHADIRYPNTVLEHPAVQATLDFRRPVAVLAVAVFHFIPEAEQIVSTMLASMAPGSYLAISTGSSDGLTADEVAQLERAYAASSVPAALRSEEEIAALFTGLDLVEPGIVPVGRWRAGEPDTHIRILAGVAYCPAG